MQSINYGVTNKFEVWKVNIMQPNIEIAFVFIMKMTYNSSDKTLTSSLRFSLLKNDLKELFDILESLPHDLQSIFEMKFEILSGTM